MVTAAVYPDLTADCSNTLLVTVFALSPALLTKHGLPSDQPSQGLQHRAAAAAAQIPQAVAPPQSAMHRPRRQRRGFLSQLLQLPVLVVGAGLKLVFEVVHFGYQCTTSVGSRVLPRSVTRTLQGTQG